MIGLAILAAGGSVRFGSPKQLITIAGESLLERAARIAKTFDGRAVIVLGSNQEAFRSGTGDVEVVVNEQWADGLSTSIHCAVRALNDCDAIVIALADQPGVGADELHSLVRVYRQTGAPVVASAYDDTVGVPALFARSHFPDLLALRGDSGARSLLRSTGVPTVAMPQAAWDIDTPEDVDRAV